MIGSASLFSQLVSIFHRGRFHKLVAKHRAERHAKGFSCWDQFVAHPAPKELCDEQHGI